MGRTHITWVLYTRMNWSGNQHSCFGDAGSVVAGSSSWAGKAHDMWGNTPVELLALRRKVGRNSLAETDPVVIDHQ